MSIGNLKTEGNKGNNFPWQLKMLLGQQCACDQLTEIVGNTNQVEFLLTAILTTLQDGTEYEAKFVLETCPGAPPTNRILLEVRVWNTDDGTWGPITYYLPGSTTPVIIDPGCTVAYTDPSGVLAMILAELQLQTPILQDIDDNTDGLEAQLTAILTAYSAGQQACASSFSVTLCTEQEQVLSNIETNTENTATNTSNALTELLAQGITLDSIESLITTLNSTVSTEATLAQVLVELEAINIDVDGLSQEATQLLVLAAITTVISNTTGLSTEVTLNALLTAFNAEDFATETTLSNLLLAFNNEDFATETTLAALNLWVQGNAATETTLQSVLVELQGINLDTNGLSQEATQLLVLTALNNILVDTANLDVPLSTVATEVTLQAVLTAINNLGLSGLATETTLQAVLAAIELCCETTNNSLKDIDSALFTLNATASTLATEATLDNVYSNTTDLLSELLNQGITLDDIETALGTLNANAATEVTLAQVLAELQAINIDTDGLSQEATQLLVLAALNTVISNTTGLATEVTLALIEAITAQMTFTGGDLNVSANMQVGDVDVSAANPVPVVFPSGGQGSRYVRTVGLAPVLIAAGATEVSVMNTGVNNITVDTGLGPEILEPGVSIGWRAREGRTLGVFNLLGSSALSKYIYTAVI